MVALPHNSITLASKALKHWLPDLAQKTLNQLSQGQRLWLVGGVVLDFLAGKPCREIDAISSLSEAALKNLGGQPIGGFFGTHLWRCGDITLEVSPLRQATLTADLAERDFSLSSIAIAWPDGLVVDSNQGRRDRNNGLVRANLGAFANDPLRILRAFRRVAEGYRLTAQTAVDLALAIPKLNTVEPSRIGRELQKILLGRQASLALQAMARFPGLLLAIDPLFATLTTLRAPGQLFNIWRHSALLVGALPPLAAWRWAALFHDTGKALPLAAKATTPSLNIANHAERSAAFAEKKLTEWGIAKDIRAHTVSLIAAHTFMPQHLLESSAALRFWLASHLTLNPPIPSQDLLDFCQADRWAAGKINSNNDLKALTAAIPRLLAEKFPLRPAELALDAAALFAEFEVSGAKRGLLLEHLWRWVLHDPPNRNQAAQLRAEAQKFLRQA